MNVLALDTTVRDGSVALVVDDRIIHERRGDRSRSHAERLPSELVTVAVKHGVALADVDVFAVAAGPGSFTGLRIGIATVQGLAFVDNRRVVAVSALEALAQLASSGLAAGAIVAAWIDAQRHDVYAALYRVSDAAEWTPERVTSIMGPRVGDPTAILRDSAHDGVTPDVCIGDGSVRYADVIRQASPGTRIIETPLLAGAIGRMAAVRAQRGEAVDPAAIQPLYVRRPDAEVDRERRSVKEGTAERR